MRFESQPSAELRRSRGHERREWSDLRDHVRDIDSERERHSNKTHRADDARRREAASQIRELRSRY